MVATRRSAITRELLRRRRALPEASSLHSLFFVDCSTLVFLCSDSRGSSRRYTNLYAVDINENILREKCSTDTIPRENDSLLPWASVIDTNNITFRNAMHTKPKATAKHPATLDGSVPSWNAGITFCRPHAESRCFLLACQGHLLTLPYPRYLGLQENLNVLPLHQHQTINRKAPDACEHVGPKCRAQSARIVGQVYQHSDPKLSPDGSMLSFVCDGDVWVKDIASGRERRLTYSAVFEARGFSSEQGTPSTRAQRICDNFETCIPKVETRHASPVRATKPVPDASYNQVPYCADVSDGRIQQTSDLRGKTCGISDYISQEEFGRFTAVWWRPERNPSTGHFELLCLQVDYSKTPNARLPSCGDAFKTLREIHYPRPGDANCIAEPVVASVPLAPSKSEHEKLAKWATTHPKDALGKYLWRPVKPVKAQFPWAEYVVRAGWLPSGISNSRKKAARELNRAATGDKCECCTSSCAYVWLQLLDRRQKVSKFVAFSTSGSGNGVVLASDTMTDLWVNVNDAYHFLERQPGLIFCSERSGYAHLYYRDLSGLSEQSVKESQAESQNVIVPVSSSMQQRSRKLKINSNDSQTIVPDKIREPRQEAEDELSGALRQITSGKTWMVEIIHFVDEARNLVYFTGTMGSPLERQLCVTSYAHEGCACDIIQLTESQYSYSNFAFNPEGIRFAASRSSVFNPPQYFVYDIRGLVCAPYSGCNECHNINQDLAQIRIQKIATLADSVSCTLNEQGRSLSVPEIFDFQTENDTTLYGALYRPWGLGDPDTLSSKEPYPAVLSVYGGPRVQTVRNDWHLTSNHTNQLLASSGYAVILIDGRGSYARGIEFEGIYGHGFGETELRDQVRGIEHLIARGIVDPARIYCTGWSYGGYASCMLLAKYPRLFRKAICGASVVNWEHYYAAYTERYLGFPDDNRERYVSSSILSHVKSLPNTSRRLLLVTSLNDENVHCSHTMALASELEKLGKPHELLIFPRERHGLRFLSSQLRFESCFLDFLNDRESDELDR